MNKNGKIAVHKDTFFQDYSDTPDIPSHWVVQYYYDKELSFPAARYFSTYEAVLDFENEIKNKSISKL